VSRRKKAAVGAILVAAVVAAAVMLALRKKSEPTTAPVGTATPESAEITWGEAVNGLRAGLVTDKRRYRSGEAITLTVQLENVGREQFEGHLARLPLAWTFSFAPVSGGRPFVFSDGRRFALEETLIVSIAPGTQEAIPFLITEQWSLRREGQRRKTRALPPGRYTVTCSHAQKKLPKFIKQGSTPWWHGEVTTAPVEIEITAKGAAP